MPPLPSAQRGQLENAVVRAGVAAEGAARAALQTLAVEDAAPFATMSDAERKLRRDLRARARQLGDGAFDHGMPLLIDEIAYEQWHRMLFARFLAENGLLRHSKHAGVSVTLQDCEELAAEEGAADGWELAARYAELMLPGLFRAADPAVRTRFAPEGRASLERILSELPGSTFTADDALGWVYQFWQKEKKKEVNASGRKIGGADLAPVTQLFTEDYMVRFLLENSLGAWWAGKHPDSPLLQDWPYLRYLDSGEPAAGAFPGWPERAAEVTVMDPCCGSGHFLVAAFDMLRRMRMEEDGLGPAEAADAVLRDNLFGLELDPRCTQIAAFAVAVAAWKAGGHPERHPPRIACSGTPVRGQLEEWLKLAKDDTNLRNTLKQLHELFEHAPTLGSLIDPRRLVERQYMAAPRWHEVEAALQRLSTTSGESAIFAYAASETAKAAILLAKRYTLVATNVPYLGAGDHSKILKDFGIQYHQDSKSNLATIFLERCITFAQSEGSVATVTPQNWLFLGRYDRFRRHLLETSTWNVLARLGPGAFETIGGQVVNVSLNIMTNEAPSLDNAFVGLDATNGQTAFAKNDLLRDASVLKVGQQEQLGNPDHRIVFEAARTEALLSRYAKCPRGIVTGDNNRTICCFWELTTRGSRWQYIQSTVEDTSFFCGREHIVDWGYRRNMLRPGVDNVAYGRDGISVSQMSALPVTLYSGELYDNNCAAIVPNDPSHRTAIWAFCSSPEFNKAVRKIDKKVNVTNATLVKVPFDLDHWQKVADEKYPDGLPEPYSDDPTQWLFKGHPVGSDNPLQVAVARLLGYHWPEQGEDDLDQYADRDGIVCLPPVGGEQPAHERLRQLLVGAYEDAWATDHLSRLLAEVGAAEKDLATWLRDDFFKQHARLFHNRPFLWHIWDGRKDGFAAIVNYHKLDAGRLDKLIYTYLGSWIARQKAEEAAGASGAEGRLRSAEELQRKLIAIRHGAEPYDIYVRWKPLHEQPIGWEPDLNDGVRLNIRPFVMAGVLRAKFSVNWNKDRGTNPDGGERRNDRHLTRAEKEQAQRDAPG